MNSNISQKLIRGDADPKQIRKLKSTLGQRQLQTNLLDGGEGHLVFTEPLTTLIGTHVSPGWAKTHFLSFSTQDEIAHKYGLGCDPDADAEHVSSLMNECAYAELGKEDWDFAVIEIDTHVADWSEIGPGVYLGKYEPNLATFKRFSDSFKCILIDVVNALKGQNDMENLDQILKNARRDMEWLLLPATPIELNFGKIQYSGILDGRIIKYIEVYKK